MESELGVSDTHYDFETRSRFPPAHHGFGARAATGVGALSSNLNGNWEKSSGVPEDDGSISLDLFIGSSVRPSFFIGGAMLLETALTDRGAVLSNKLDGRALVTRRSGIVGPFIDIYPDLESGLHLGGAAGVSVLRFEAEASASSLNTFGVGGAFWVGEDFWITPQWALGPMVRFMSERTWSTDEISSSAGWADSVTLSFSARYQ
ncbi:MAG TPA: hypothetical protein VHV51_12370 [Polyangiaceae bacterium]|nr:hypothetical protein [Polyangiaceae bacterium]